VYKEKKHKVTVFMPYKVKKVAEAFDTRSLFFSTRAGIFLGLIDATQISIDSSYLFISIDRFSGGFPAF